MRKLISLSPLLAFSLLCSVLPIAKGVNNITTARGQRNTRHKKGAEVATRVRQLREQNKNVHRALTDFERNEKRNGNKPRIDESESFTIDAAGGTAALKTSPFRKVGYKPQDYSGNGLEVIVITTYAAPGEWQGTIIYNMFDPSGAYLGEYVANVIIGPDLTYTLPDVILEVSYESGQAYLEYGDANVYGELGDPGLGFEQPQQITSNGRSIFKKASFSISSSDWTVRSSETGSAKPKSEKLCKVYVDGLRWRRTWLRGCERFLSWSAVHSVFSGRGYSG